MPPMLVSFKVMLRGLPPDIGIQGVSALLAAAFPEKDVTPAISYFESGKIR